VRRPRSIEASAPTKDDHSKSWKSEQILLVTKRSWRLGEKPPYSAAEEFPGKLEGGPCAGIFLRIFGCPPARFFEGWVAWIMFLFWPLYMFLRIYVMNIFIL
jgi:hypothetical protein